MWLCPHHLGVLQVKWKICPRKGMDKCITRILCRKPYPRFQFHHRRWPFERILNVRSAESSFLLLPLKALTFCGRSIAATVELLVGVNQSTASFSVIFSCFFSCSQYCSRFRIMDVHENSHHDSPKQRITLS